MSFIKYFSYMQTQQDPVPGNANAPFGLNAIGTFRKRIYNHVAPQQANKTKSDDEEAKKEDKDNADESAAANHPQEDGYGNGVTVPHSDHFNPLGSIKQNVSSIGNVSKKWIQNGVAVAAATTASAAATVASSTKNLKGIASFQIGRKDGGKRHEDVNENDDNVEIPQEILEALEIMRKENIKYNLKSVMDDPRPLNLRNIATKAPDKIIKEVSSFVNKHKSKKSNNTPSNGIHPTATIDPGVNESGDIDNGSDIGQEYISTMTALPPVIIPNVDIKDFIKHQKTYSQLVSLYVKNHENREYEEEIAEELSTQSYQQFLQMIDSLENGNPPPPDGPAMFALATAGSSFGSYGAKRLNSILPRCLQIVPDRYFKYDFKVMADDAGIFAYLDKPGETERVQAMLASCLDLVEVCLWSQTTSRARDFFDAITYLGNLLGYVNVAYARTTIIRNSLRSLQQTTAVQQIKILQLRQKRENAKRLLLITEGISEVVGTKTKLRDLIGNGDFMGALEVVERVQKLLIGELKGVNCLKNYGEVLLDCQEWVGAQISSRFVAICISVLDGTWDPTRAGNEVVELSFEEESEILRKQLSPYVCGLLKTGMDRFVDTLKSYRLQSNDVVEKAFNLTINETLRSTGFDVYRASGTLSPSHQVDHSEDVLSIMGGGTMSPNLMNAARPQGPTPFQFQFSHQQQQHQQQQNFYARNDSRESAMVMSMTPTDFVSFLKQLFDSIEGAIDPIILVSESISTIVDKDLPPVEKTPTHKQAQRPMNPYSHSPSHFAARHWEIDSLGLVASRFAALSNETRSKVKHESQNVVSHAFEHAQRLVASVIKFRTESLVNGKLSDLKAVINASLAFIGFGEEFCGYKGNELRNVLSDQVTRYFYSFNDSQRLLLRESIENELWDIAVISPEIQEVVDRICNENAQKLLQGYLTSFPSNNPTQPSAPGDTGVHDLHINGKPFKATTSSLTLVKSLEGYLCCVIEFPILGSRLISKVFEIIKVYNEMVHKSILDAHAVTRFNKLKKITTKNLALSVQSLSVILSIIPSMNIILDKCVSSQGQAHRETESNRITNILEEHRKKVINKLVALVDSRLMHCCQNVSTSIDWDSRGSEGLVSARDYMVDLTQAIASFHKSLSSILNKEYLQLIFNDIFKIMNDKVPELYSDVNPVTQAGKARVRVDLYQLLSTLRIRGLQVSAVDRLEEWVVAKYGEALHSDNASVSN